MPTGQPSVTDAAGQRSFACSPAAVAAFIVDESERLLLVSCPEKRGAPDRWEVLNGALEAGETLLEGVLRDPERLIGFDTPALRQKR